MAGTPSSRVTRCRWTASMSAVGSNWRSITWRPPIIVTKWGTPHPFT